MGFHSLHQKIFPTQGLNLGLLHCRQILYHLSHQGRPWFCMIHIKKKNECALLCNCRSCLIKQYISFWLDFNEKWALHLWFYICSDWKDIPQTSFGCLHSRFSSFFFHDLHPLVCACECLVARSCPTLCDPGDCGLPGSLVHGFSRQEYWSRCPFPIPADLPNLGIKPASHISCIGWQVLYH